MSTLDHTTRTATASQAVTEPLVSVVIPCLNEAESIARCVEIARSVLEEHGLAGEVVVADNGSDDGSPDLARAAGAHVVHESRRGYGSAYLAGLAAARGKYVVMADADLTYDLRDIPRFVAELEDGADLVMGNRMANIQPGAMHWMHRYIGNPALTGMLNLFYRTGVDDAHCGMRALRRSTLPRLDLRSTGMEFASEMVIRAAKAKLDIRQFEIVYHPRAGDSKLSRWRDGWRHVRFLLVHSPTWLFLVPGAVMLLVGTLIMAAVLAGVTVFGREWFVHTAIAGGVLMMLGAQVVALGFCAHAYGAYFMGEQDRLFDWGRQRFKLEHGLVLGIVVAIAGIAVGGFVLGTWIDRGLGSLTEQSLAVLAATLVVVGAQIVFSSFLLSILGLRRQQR